jgi:hypothetical protein
MPILWRNILPPTSRLMPPTCLYPPTRPYNITTQKTTTNSTQSTAFTTVIHFIERTVAFKKPKSPSEIQSQCFSMSIKLQKYLFLASSEHNKATPRKKKPSQIYQTTQTFSRQKQTSNST